MTTTLSILDCKTCAACCTQVGIPPYTVRELWRLPADIRSWVVGLISESRPTGRCAALGDDKLCRIYKHRPAVCVSFKSGDAACLADRNREGVA